ncbi:FAD-binding protein [uncultured Parolsenella sp.]|uniref:FAD-binding protein n=1 Tax=uncultured Parolsenella sp. TaxID=2083008 RepID=UPI0027D96120|nr:FAD-binding protein [uncultured Parolsenella sp.]
MSGLVVDAATCVGCRRCVRVCGNDGIEVVNRKARVLDGCISCGMCVDACPVGALSIEKDAAGGADLAAYRDVWVFAQADGAGRVLPVALELVGKGRELADARGCSLVAVLGEGSAETDVDPNARLLLAAGVDGVIRCRDERLAVPDSEVYAEWIRELAEARKPEVILYGATDFGRELAPRVAVLLQTGLTADCTILEMDEEHGLLQQTRPAFGGNLMATIVCPSHRPQMATVRPGIFPVPETAQAVDASAAGNLGAQIEDVALDPAVRPLVRVTHVEPKSSEGSITSADALVVVGRGIGSKKAVPQMRRLAELMGERFGCRCDLGCTRPVVEAGWLDYAHQVGQTGVSVAPRLLVSVGCSGAIQHVAGIGGAQVIVAVNEDPTAPIFDVAQYKVVGDCHEVVASLIERLERES